MLFCLGTSIVEFCVLRAGRLEGIRRPRLLTLVYQGYGSGVSWLHLARALVAICGGGDLMAMSFNATDYLELRQYKR
jgi:hypothetical protein